MRNKLLAFLPFILAACATKPAVHSFFLKTNPIPGEYFTLGSTKSEVQTVHGPPTSITTRIKTFHHSSDESWSYGTSHVYFRNDRVYGWKSSHLEKEPLKAYLPTNSTAKSFSQGSTLDDVVSAMGTPTGIEPLELAVWVHFGKARVDLRNGLVAGWDDPSGILRLGAR